MLILRVEITGATALDIEAALEEIQRQIEQGFTSGSDRSETGTYTYERTGEDALEPVEIA